MSQQAAKGGPTEPIKVPHAAVIAAVVPEQSPRVLKEAARQAKALGAPLIVVHVDTSRFVTYQDPDGWVRASPIEGVVETGATDLDTVTRTAHEVLDGHGVDFEVHQLVGDPAMALKHLGDASDARLYVVGTRRRGFGESIREFFTGSVAARLAHRQTRPILVVPLGEPVTDDDAAYWEN